MASRGAAIDAARQESNNTAEAMDQGPRLSQEHRGAAPCLSFPIYRGVMAGGRCRQPGPWGQGLRLAGIQLFSNLKSNLVLPPRPGPAAVMNELSGSRRHAPPSTGYRTCLLGARPPSPCPALVAVGNGDPRYQQAGNEGGWEAVGSVIAQAVSGCRQERWVV